MSAPKSRIQRPEGFNVTVQSVIGRIEFGEGTDHPEVAAMRMIGLYMSGPGLDEPEQEYSFPGEGGERIGVLIQRQKESHAQA